ncbi:MAG: hypothetical protein VW521_12635 [Rhodospirillales bacterium]|jgi:hypothetical protein
MNVMQLISDLAAIAPMVVTVCSVIAAVTPTPQDDAWMAKLYRFIDIMAINVGKAKQ